jgi:hypothetical protein
MSEALALGQSKIYFTTIKRIQVSTQDYSHQSAVIQGLRLDEMQTLQANAQPRFCGQGIISGRSDV